MIPQYERLDSSQNKPYIKFRFGRFSVFVVCLPLFGIIFCVIWSILYYFERSTSTHCEVDNYLPSISAAIGNYQPQRFIWQLAICVHFLPRLLIARMYLEFFNETIRMNRRPTAYLAYSLSLIENIALLGLSLWTSSEDYEIHKFCFGLFIAMSEIYMLLSCFLFKYGKKTSILSDIEEISLKYKRNLFLINILSFCMAGYWFLRHNSHCETGDYTLFAFFEYIVVLTNMAFHMTSYYDFYGRSVAYEWKQGFYFTHQ